MVSHRELIGSRSQPWCQSMAIRESSCLLLRAGQQVQKRLRAALRLAFKDTESAVVLGPPPRRSPSNANSRCAKGPACMGGSATPGESAAAAGGRPPSSKCGYLVGVSSAEKNEDPDACPNCGARVESSISGPTEQLREATERRCPSCGKVLRRDIGGVWSIDETAS